MDKRKLYIDFDSTIVNSIKRICEMYNEDYKDKPNFKFARWEYVEKFNFSDQCNLAKDGVVKKYFNTKRFYQGLEFMESAKEIIELLSQKFDIYVPSLGYTTNLKYKNIWLKENLSCIKKFIPCHFNLCKDKAHIKMSNSILIDDNAGILITSDADLKICYGDLYDWNKNWDGNRCWNWTEVYDFLMD